MSDELNTLKADIEELENVADADDSSDESTADDLFSISSHGVDQTVEVLVSKMKKEQYIIPDFQRDYVWSKNDASKFIESLLLGLPVPGIFLYKESDTPKHLVIDGQQRLKSVEKFYKGIFGHQKFTLSGLKSKWNGLSYDDLDEDDQARLDDAIVHVTIFKQDTPTNNMDSVYEVFERINTGGMRLSPQEIRSCVAHGSFNKFLFELNDNPKWRNIFGAKSKRLKDVELILRFFAFKDALDQYERPMRKFLTDFMTTNREPALEKFAAYKTDWELLLTRVTSACGDRPFRPSSRALNVAFFDSFCVALSHTLSSQKQLTDTQIKTVYDKLAQDNVFLKLISSGTAADEAVRKRFEMAAQEFARC